jgi:hypothetical protein
VSGSPSGSGSSKKNPFETLAVTIPGTSEAAKPSTGDRCAAPWISWMRWNGVANDQVKFAAIVSGGSSASVSVTCPARIVTEQDSAGAKSASGSIVKVVGPPLAVAVWSPLSAHEIENQAPATETGSLNVTERSEPTATPVAPAAGEVASTCGAASPTTVECAPRPVKSSVANPSHSTAGSKASLGFVSPVSIAPLRRRVLSAVLVSPVPHSVPGSKPSWPITSMSVAPFRSTTTSSPLNHPEPFV